MCDCSTIPQVDASLQIVDPTAVIPKVKSEESILAVISGHSSQPEGTESTPHNADTGLAFQEGNEAVTDEGIVTPIQNSCPPTPSPNLNHSPYVTEQVVVRTQQAPPDQSPYVTSVEAVELQALRTNHLIAGVTSHHQSTVPISPWSSYEDKGYYVDSTVPSAISVSTHTDNSLYLLSGCEDNDDSYVQEDTCT